MKELKAMGGKSEDNMDEIRIIKQNKKITFKSISYILNSY